MPAFPPPEPGGDVPAPPVAVKATGGAATYLAVKPKVEGEGL